MSSSTQILTLVLNGNAAGALSAVQSVYSKMGGIGGMVAGATAAVVNKTIELIQSLFSKIAELGEWAASKIFTMGASMESTRMAFSVMMRDVLKGNAMLKQLNDFANVTPYTNDEVIAAGRALLGYGMHAGTVARSLQVIGDVASGAQQPLKELTAIYGKTMATGKVSSETLNQFSERSVPILKTLAEMYGVTAGEIYKMAENGKLTARDIEAAFQRMTGAGGQFEGMMAKQSGTVNGMWSTLTGKIDLMAAKIGEKFMPIIAKVMEQVTAIIDRVMAFVDSPEFVNLISELGLKAVTYLNEVLIKINTVGQYVWAVASVVYDVLRVIHSGVMGVVLQIIAFFTEKFIDGLNQMIDAYNTVAGWFGGEQAGHVGGEGLLEWMNQASGEHYNAATDAAGRLGDFAYFENAAKNVETFNKTINEFSQAAKGGILEWRKSEKQKIDEQRTQIDFGESPVEQVVSAVADALGSAVTPQMERMNFDAMTRMGLYNFPGESDGGLDRERNSLLKTISRKIGAVNMI